jgi:hypothetical protein
MKDNKCDCSGHECKHYIYRSTADMSCCYQHDNYCLKKQSKIRQTEREIDMISARYGRGEDITSNVKREEK